MKPTNSLAPLSPKLPPPMTTVVHPSSSVDVKSGRVYLWGRTSLSIFMENGMNKDVSITYPALTSSFISSRPGLLLLLLGSIMLAATNNGWMQFANHTREDCFSLRILFVIFRATISRGTSHVNTSHNSVVQLKNSPLHVCIHLCHTQPWLRQIVRFD